MYYYVTSVISSHLQYVEQYKAYCFILTDDDNFIYYLNLRYQLIFNTFHNICNFFFICLYKFCVELTTLLSNLLEKYNLAVN